MSAEEQAQAVETGPTNDERSMWMSRIMEEDAEALELRERTYPWTKMHSFGMLKRANFTTCKSHIDRHKVLQLIYQHLHSIGMHHAAFTLADESQLEFQRKDQMMDRTDLRLILSMSLGPRDNLWDLTGIDSTVLVEEPFDDDNGSMNYVEPTEGYTTPMEHVEFKEGADQTFENISYATLRSLVVFLVDGAPIKPTDADKKKFFLLMNSICRSEHMFEHLYALFNTGSDETKENVVKFMNEWVRFSGLFIGKRTIRMMTLFLQTIDYPVAKDLLKIIPTLVYGHPSCDDLSPPAPVIEDPVKLLHPNLTMAEPEPEEMARQISLVVQSLFAAIHPREFYFAISNRTLSLDTPGINELHEFGKKLKLLIASTILGEKNETECAKKMERIIEIMTKLADINNFEAVSWFVSAFEMQCITNLSNTAAKISQQAREELEKLKENYDWKKKSTLYDLRIQQCFVNGVSAVPNMRYELSIVTVPGWGGVEFDNDRINWEKRNRAASFIVMYDKFQNIPYNFHKISQIQGVLERGSKFTKEQLNEMSIQLESPIKTDAEVPSPEGE